jgi:hypothetical protein
MIMQNLESLITAYLTKAELCSFALREHCCGMHPVRAWRERKITAQGQLEHPEQCNYSMHGIGCQFTAEKWAVDVDFDASGNCGGFDAWRLAQFARSLSVETQWPLSRIESEVRSALEKGILLAVADLPCNHLVQLAPTPYSRPQMTLCG